MGRLYQRSAVGPPNAKTRQTGLWVERSLRDNERVHRSSHARARKVSSSKQFCRIQARDAMTRNYSFISQNFEAAPVFPFLFYF